MLDGGGGGGLRSTGGLQAEARDRSAEIVKKEDDACIGTPLRERGRPGPDAVFAGFQPPSSVWKFVTRWMGPE